MGDAVVLRRRARVLRGCFVGIARALRGLWPGVAWGRFLLGYSLGVPRVTRPGPGAGCTCLGCTSMLYTNYIIGVFIQRVGVFLVSPTQIPLGTGGIKLYIYIFFLE